MKLQEGFSACAAALNKIGWHIYNLINSNSKIRTNRECLQTSTMISKGFMSANFKYSMKCLLK